MPIMALFRSPFIDQNLYDAIIRELDLQRRPAAGALTHACGFDGKGVCVMDVWETRKDFETFLATRLKPAFAKLGIAFTAPEIFDAYSFNVAEAVERYRAEPGAGFGAARETAAAEPTAAAPH